MRFRVMMSLAVAAIAVFATAYAADEIKVDGIKCVVAANKDAKAANAVDYKGGKVFFCCMNCPKAFAADKAKFAARANYQLVATKQAKQVACPFTGEAVDAATKIKVEGAEVAFCCDMCKGKAEAVKGAEQITLVFAEKGFDKAFKVGEAK